MDNNMKFRSKYFAAYGLNKFRNYLKNAPDSFRYNGRVRINANTYEELVSFMMSVLDDMGNRRGAIFAHAYNDQMYALAIVSEISGFQFDTPYVPFATETLDMDFFITIDAKLDLSIYALLVQEPDGTWEIVEN